jgi:hypothetical protein
MEVQLQQSLPLKALPTKRFGLEGGAKPASFALKNRLSHGAQNNAKSSARIPRSRRQPNNHLDANQQTSVISPAIGAPHGGRWSHILSTFPIL